MKLIAIVFLTFSSFSFAQTDLDDTGFSEIRLGKTFESIEERLSLIDIVDVPQYAWFAPMSLDYWLSNGEDTASYFEMLETDRLIAESLNTKVVPCTFEKKKDAKFFSYPVDCAQLIFVENALKGIILAFNPDDMTQEAKESIFEQFKSEFGEVVEENSSVAPPSESDLTWKVNGRMIRISDSESMDGGAGQTLHILYWQE